MFSTFSLMSGKSIGRDVERILLVLAIGEAAALVGLVVELVAALAEQVPTALVGSLLNRPST